MIDSIKVYLRYCIDSKILIVAFWVWFPDVTGKIKKIPVSYCPKSHSSGLIIKLSQPAIPF